MAFFEEWTLNLLPTLTPPSALARRGQFPDVLGILTALCATGNSCRRTHKAFLRLCRVASAASAIWFVCVMLFVASLLLALAFWVLDVPQASIAPAPPGVIQSASPQFVKVVLAICIALFIFFALASGAVRQAAQSMAEDLSDGKRPDGGNDMKAK